MSTVNETTEALGLPLPHPNNKLEADVLRLRDAMQAVDAAMLAVQQAVAQKASDAEVAHSLEQLQLAVQGLGTGKVASVNGVTGVNITLTPAHLSLGPANGPASCTYSYDEDGRITQINQSVQDDMATTALSYNEAGCITQKQIAYRGRVRTEVFTYTAAGRVQSVAATEVEGVA